MNTTYIPVVGLEGVSTASLVVVDVLVPAAVVSVVAVSAEVAAVLVSIGSSADLVSDDAGSFTCFSSGFSVPEEVVVPAKMESVSFAPLAVSTADVDSVFTPDL